MSDHTQTLYERIGGEPSIRTLVQHFYDLMDLEPKYKILRDVHHGSLDEAVQKFTMFLSGWTGGPDVYVQAYGYPRLKSRHFPFKIGTVERDQWMACFIQSLHELNIAPEIQAEILPPIYALAEWMRNQTDAIEGAPMPPMQGQMSADYVHNRLAQLAHTYEVKGWSLSA